MEAKTMKNDNVQHYIMWTFKDGDLVLKDVLLF